MNIPELPNVDGLREMSPLEMNNVHFDKLHRVLTPTLLSHLNGGTSGQ